MSESNSPIQKVSYIEIPGIFFSGNVIMVKVSLLTKIMKVEYEYESLGMKVEELCLLWVVVSPTEQGQSEPILCNSTSVVLQNSPARSCLSALICCKRNDLEVSPHVVLADFAGTKKTQATGS